MPKHLLIIFLFVAPAVFSQQKGEIMFNVRPKNAVIRVGGILVTELMKPVQLDTGKHVVKIWAPKMDLHIDTFHVKPGDPVTYSKGLTYTSDYREFRKELFRYRFNRFMIVKSPLFTVAATGALSAAGYGHVRSLDKQLEDKKENIASTIERYEKSFTLAAIEANKTQYEIYVEDYEKTLKKRYVYMVSTITAGIAGIAGAIIMAYRVKKWESRLEKPVYNEKPLLSRVNIGLIPSYNGTQMHFTYNF